MEQKGLHSVEIGAAGEARDAIGTVVMMMAHRDVPCHVIEAQEAGVAVGAAAVDPERAVGLNVLHPLLLHGQHSQAEGAQVAGQHAGVLGGHVISVLGPRG